MVPLRATIFATILALPASGVAQTRFGIEVSAGQGAGLIPAAGYVQNVPYTQDDRVFLANEVADNGLALATSFVFTDLELNVRAQLFERSRLALHHAAAETGGLPADRVRPDGTIDDSGYSYSPISTTVVTAADRSRGSLLATEVSGGWRYYVLSGDVDVWVPFSAGVAVMHILEDARPWVFGATVSSGVGVTFEVAPPISLIAQARLHGVMTPSYGSQQDAARTSANLDESTLDAATAALLYSTFGIGIQVAIR